MELYYIIAVTDRDRAGEMAELYQAGAIRVMWGEGSAFNGDGEVTYTEIQANERCRGTITLAAL